MVNLNTPFRKTLSISINSSSNTNIHGKKLFKVALTSVYLAKSVLKYKSNEVFHGTKQRLRQVTIPYMYFVFDDKMIIYQRIKLKFSQQIKHLLFYFP